MPLIHHRPRLPVRCPAMMVRAAAILAAAILAAASCLRAAPLADPEVDAFNHRMSAINIGPDYRFTAENVLIEGARVVTAMGANSYKFAMKPKPGYGIEPPSSVTSLTELARDEPSYRALFDLPGLRHYVFWCYTFANPDHWKWRNGLSAAEATAEYNEIRELASHLLTQYNHSGKSFYLGHWEGDWSVGVPDGGAGNPDPVSIRGMIDWLNIRQQAVDDAKAATPHAGVNVFLYTEVNRVVDAHVNPPSSNQRVINAVVPHVPNLDFISWSSYDIQNRSPEEIHFYLDFAESFLPPAKSTAIHGKRVFIGEYGWGNLPETEQALKIAAYNRTLFEWGCPFSFYWELYAQIPGTEYFDLIDINGAKTANYWIHQRYANAAKLALLEFKQHNARLPTDAEFSAMSPLLMDAALVDPVALAVEHLPARVTGRDSVTLACRLRQGIYGADQARAFLCWGTADGGTNLSGWQNVVDLGLNALAITPDIPAALNGLASNTTYHYRFCATNQQTTAWGTATATFVTAEVHTFTPTAAGSYSWNTAANWNPWGVPSGGPFIGVTVFENTHTPLGSGSLTLINDPATLTINSLVLNGLGPAGTAAASVEVGTSGNVWTLAGSAREVALNGGNHARALTVSVLPDLAMTGDTIISGNGSAKFQFSGAIGGPGALVKTGSSALVLSGTNSFTGGLDVRQGMVTCNSSASFGSGPIVLGDTAGGAQATICGFSSSVTTDKPIHTRSGGTGTVTIRNPSFGSLNFLGNLTLDRSVVVDGGTSNSAFTIFKTGTLAGSGDIVASSASSNATVILQHPASASYTGSVFVQKGNLRLANAGALNAANTVRLKAGAVVDVRAGVTIAGLQGASGSTVLCNDGSVSRTLSLGGSGSYYHAGEIRDATTSGRTLSIAKTGTGTQTLAGSNTFSGGLTITGGTLQANSTAALGNGKVTLGGGARKLLFAASGTCPNDLELTGGSGVSGQGLLDTDSNIHAVVGGPVLISASPLVAGAGHFGASSTGLLTVNGFIDSSVPVDWRRNTGVFAGGGNYANFRIRSGTVRLGRSDGLATSATVELGTNGNSTFDLAGFDQTLAGITNGSSPATITNNSVQADSLLRITGSCSYSGTVSDGAVRKTSVTIDGGTVTLGGTCTHGGPTRVMSGALVIGPGASFSGTSHIRLAAGARLDTTAQASFPSAAAQAITFALEPSGACGRIDAAGIDIRNMRVGFEHATTPAAAVYRLASYQAMVGAAFASVTPPDGYAIDYQHAGGTAIALLATRLHLWRQLHFPGSTSLTGPGADLAGSSGDGLTNLVKFSLAMDPHLPAAMPVTFTRSAESLHFTYTPSADAVMDGVVFTVEYSDDLSVDGWRSDSVNQGMIGGGGLPVTAEMPAGTKGRRFVRLKVSVPQSP